MKYEVGDEMPILDGHDEHDNKIMIPALERWTWLWFNPVFGRYGCKECETSLIHELYPELRMAGIMVYGASYDPPEINARRNEVHVWRIPIIQIDKTIATEWGALRTEDDSWFNDAPASVSYLIDPTGILSRVDRLVDHTKIARNILKFVESANQGSQLL